MLDRRNVLAGSVLGAAALLPAAGKACAVKRLPLDRAAFDRYFALFNAGDQHFVDYYADDVDFLGFLKGKPAVLEFYAAQRPYIKESIELLFFCSDTNGAAIEVRGMFRCIKETPDATLAGRVLKVGEVQRTHGYILYVLNDQGKIVQMKGPPPEIVQPWKLEA